MHSGDKTENWQPFYYIIDYINKHYFVTNSGRPPFAQEIYYQLTRDSQTKQLLLEGRPETRQQLDKEIHRLFLLSQDEFEKTLQTNLAFLEHGLKYIQNIDARNFSPQSMVSQDYLEKFNKKLNDDFNALSSSDFRGDIFIGEQENIHLTELHERLHQTIESAYNWSNYSLLASKFIIDPNKRSAIAEKANRIKNEVRDAETQLSAKMRREDKIVSTFGGSMLTAGIAVFTLGLLFLPLTSIPLLLTMIFVASFFVVIGAAASGLGILEMLVDKSRERTRAKYFAKINTRNHDLIKEATRDLNTIGKESLSHSAEMFKVVGAPNHDKLSESQLDAKSKSSVSIVEDKKKNEIELVSQSSISDKRLKR